ncbi:hypothetical protein HMPREF9074_09490 [Capnocytophaga sp. oral taxon 329 str. F0087]|nr:hypothetical protein HMPREF9074_09490 [Capnocytophaga sp. oral taxon 329 str. F0087]
MGGLGGMGGLRVAYFSGFVADFIISFVGASYILSISIIYFFCTEDIIAVFLK